MHGTIDQDAVAKLVERMDRTSNATILQSLAWEFSQLSRDVGRLGQRLDALGMLAPAHEAFVDAVAGRDLVAELPRDLPSTLVIDATHDLPAASGFHGVQIDALGLPYRWTGPTREFSFDVLIARDRPARFRLHFASIYADVAEPVLGCFVDGEEVAVETTEAGGNIIAQGTLRARREPGRSILTFLCPAVASPAATGRSQDRRSLGLSFRRLELEGGTSDGAGR
ncbi:MAG TPA: hypothetical protein VKS60_10465 [Stellaceae bacterium]|nr:hypothetical protein [Stellaceae bacterium]